MYTDSVVAGLTSKKQHLKSLAAYIYSTAFRDQFIPAYLADTQFVRKQIIEREIETTFRLLQLNRPDENSFSGRRPLGKVAVFMPKNSLGLTLAKAIASSYLMGNETVVYFPSALKKSAPIYADALVRHLDQIEIADFKLSSAQFLRECFANPAIRAIVIYGDDAWVDAYKELAKASHTKVIFEGPGNDPFVVLPDARLAEAVDGALEGGLINGGQSCSAIERFFIHVSLYDSFARLLAERVRQIKTGPSDEPATDIGPIMSRIIFQRMKNQVDESLAMGAVLLEGSPPYSDAESGFTIFPPTILTHCTIEMPVVKEETFGPVFPLIPFSGIQELIDMLDQTRYGLNASVYGYPSPELREYLVQNHRNVYFNSTPASAENLQSRLMDGGFRRSGMIWDFASTGNETTGIRTLTMELSQPM